MCCMVLFVGMSIIGVMVSTTRGRQSCLQQSTLSCWWNGLRYKSTTKSCFHRLLVCHIFVHSLHLNCLCCRETEHLSIYCQDTGDILIFLKCFLLLCCYTNFIWRLFAIENYIPKFYTADAQKTGYWCSGSQGQCDIHCEAKNCTILFVQ